MSPAKPKKESTHGLTPKEAAFVREYLVDANGAKACERAGYSKKTARSQASRLLTKVNVAEAVEAGRKLQEDDADGRRKRIRQELSHIAFSDVREAFDKLGNLKPVHQLPDTIARAISSVEEVEKLFGDRKHQGRLHKVRLWSKEKALEQLARLDGLVVEKHEIDVGPTLAELVAKSFEVKS